VEALGEKVAVAVAESLGTADLARQGQVAVAEGAHEGLEEMQAVLAAVLGGVEP